MGFRCFTKQEAIGPENRFLKFFRSRNNVSRLTENSRGIALREKYSQSAKTPELLFAQTRICRIGTLANIRRMSRIRSLINGGCGGGEPISVISSGGPGRGLNVLMEQFPSLVSSYNPRAFRALTLEITALTLSVASSRNC